MTRRTIFESKAAGETKKLTFDFLSELAVSETISSAPVTAAVFSGTDATPSAIISGSSSISGSVVTQTIAAGTAGVTYLLTCTATTSTSQVLILTAYLTIVS